MRSVLTGGADHPINRIAEATKGQAQILATTEPMDVVIANQPKTFAVDGSTTTQIDHATAQTALKAMKDKSRAVLLSGSIKE